MAWCFCLGFGVPLFWTVFGIEINHHHAKKWFSNALNDQTCPFCQSVGTLVLMQCFWRPKFAELDALKNTSRRTGLQVGLRRYIVALQPATGKKQGRPHLIHLEANYSITSPHSLSKGALEHHEKLPVQTTQVMLVATASSQQTNCECLQQHPC